jgi:hypothetical protein
MSEKKTVFKFNEDKRLQELLDYLETTYSAHYAQDDGIQSIDVMISMDPEKAHFYCQCNVLKYIMRYGKKGGFNRKDLQKVMHYLLFMMHIEDKYKIGEQTDSIDGDSISQVIK